MLISQISNQLLCDVSKEIVLLQTGKTTTFQNLQLPRRKKHIKTATNIKHLKTERYRGLANCGEVDYEFDLNRLDSVIRRQFTTVTNQC